MRDTIHIRILGGLVLFCGLLLSVNGATTGRQTDTAKLYAEISGDYEFVMGMDMMTISFWMEDGKLMGGPPGETPEELIPVEGDDLKFTVTIPSGEEYTLTFIRDDAGNISRCLMETSMGDAQGDKIKE